MFKKFVIIKLVTSLNGSTSNEKSRFTKHKMTGFSFSIRYVGKFVSLLCKTLFQTLKNHKVLNCYIYDALS